MFKRIETFSPIKYLQEVSQEKKSTIRWFCLCFAESSKRKEKDFEEIFSNYNSIVKMREGREPRQLCLGC